MKNVGTLQHWHYNVDNRIRFCCFKKIRFCGFKSARFLKLLMRFSIHVFRK